MVSQCESKYSCKASGCNKRHHNLLHRETSTKNSAILTKIDENTQALNTGNAPPNTRSLPPNTANSETAGGSVNNQNIFNNTNNVSAMLQIVPVIMKNGYKSVKTNALLDSESDVTLINKDLDSKLHLSADSKELNICNAISEVSSKPVKFQVSSVCNSFQKSDINVFVVNALNVQPNSFKTSSLKNDYPYIRDINFPILNSSYVDLPIGTNKADLLLQRGFRQCDTNEPLAIKTCLGWMLMGVYSKRSNREKTKSCNHITKISNESLSKEIERFWQIESYGTLSKLDLNLLFPTEQQALQILENNTILKNGLFETPLLWKSESPKLPNNGTLAEKWFQSLENKFAKNPEFAELYRKQINEYIDLGHAVIIHLTFQKLLITFIIMAI